MDPDAVGPTTHHFGSHAPPKLETWMKHNQGFQYMEILMRFGRSALMRDGQYCLQTMLQAACHHHFQHMAFPVPH